MQKPSIIFGAIIFIITSFLTFLNLSKLNVTGLDLVFNLLITSVLLSVLSAIAYFYGVKKSAVNPPVSKTLMAALFASFVGNSFSMVFGLKEISWFLFPLAVIILSYLAPVRFFKPKEVTGE